MIIKLHPPRRSWGDADDAVEFDDEVEYEVFIAEMERIAVLIGDI